MSKQALFHYAQNLRLVQRATFTDHTGKERGLGENGRDLLVFLCDAANESRDFCFHMGYQYIAEETGIHISTVKRLMAGLEQLGWITRTGELVRHKGRGAPTVEYCLTFYAPMPQSERTGSQFSRPTSSQVATDNLGKSNTAKSAPKNRETEPEPKPETEPQPEQGSGQGKEWGKFHEEVLSDCLAWERAHFTGIDKGGLQKTWEKDYRPLVALAIETTPGASKSEQVTWCVQQRQARRGTSVSVANATVKHLPDPPTGSPDCEHGCDNGLHYPRDPVTDLVTSRKCVCSGGTYTPTQEATNKRVSPGEGANTYIPPEGDTAEPQSDPVRDLAKRLRRVS